MNIPDDLRVACSDDFIDFDNHLKPLIGLEFWVHTYHSDELEKHKTWRGMDIDRWKPWLDDKRIFVKKNYRLKKFMKDTDFLNY